MSFTDRQSVAISQPAARAVDSIHDRYQKTVEYRGRTFSTIVTVNK